MSEPRAILHPAKPRKPRFKSCGSPECSEMFEVRRLGQKTCANAKCALAYIRAEKRAEALREIRKERQVFRAKNKPVSKLLREAQHEFNCFIRERDWGKDCICCGNPTGATSDVLRGHLVDAGHYRSIGAAAHLRFNEDNVHAQLVACNRDKSGNVVEYRKGLIARIGLARVEAIENDNRTVKWDREELVQIRRKYLALWKQLRAAREAKS